MLLQTTVKYIAHKLHHTSFFFFLREHTFSITPIKLDSIQKRLPAPFLFKAIPLQIYRYLMHQNNSFLAQQSN